MKFFLTCLILIFSISLSAKSFNEIDFVNNTGDKKVTTINDGVTFFILLTDNKIDDSLLYNITRAKRYAFRLCVSEGIMKFNGSEYDKISGSELIEVVSKVSEKKGDR